MALAGNYPKVKSNASQKYIKLTYPYLVSRLDEFSINRSVSQPKIRIFRQLNLLFWMSFPEIGLFHAREIY